MSSSTTAALRKPQSLAELLDARPDTREMISANLNLAHACLLLKQGESEEVERALRLAQKTVSPGLASISRCIRAESLRISGRESEAWDMAEELVAEDRFDVVAALYLRHLFPLRKNAGHGSASAAAPVATESVAMESVNTPAPPAPQIPSAWETSLPAESSLPAEPAIPLPPQAPAEVAPPAPSAQVPAAPAAVAPEASAIASPLVAEPAEALSVSDQASVLQDDDSELALVPDAPPESPDAVGEFPAALRKVADDGSVVLLRHRAPDGSLAEIVRSGTIGTEIEPLLVDRASQALRMVGFGKIVHASFEGSAGAAHSWTRGGRTLLLAVKGASSAPALAARCTRAMEELR